MPFPSDTKPDTVVFDLIDAEVQRQCTGLQLIASENFTSPAVMRAVGSALTNKYAEGYPGKRYYGGNLIVDEIEALAIERVKQLFGADHANVQPHIAPIQLLRHLKAAYHRHFPHEWYVDAFLPIK